MSNLAAAPNQWNSKERASKAIIETPKGRRSKFKYDPEYELFALGGLLPEGLVFPFDFGFIPSTIGGDGDPLDIMVLMDEPAHVGCLIDVRVIGVMEAEQTEDGKTIENDRLIGVAAHSFEHSDISSIDHLSKSLIEQVENFFIAYNKGRGRKFKLRSVHGPGRAAKLIDQGIREFRKKKAAA
jgi:inorganic pyrophosphatase